MDFLYIFVDMNFLSHFYLDREIENAPFIVGVCTPDLVSLYSREIRIKHLPVLPAHSSHYISFTQGIQRHFEADKIFHSSPFFLAEMEQVNHFLNHHFTEIPVKRSFFVAHVLVELLIDKVLISKDEKLIPDFYQHFHKVGHTHIAEMTQIAVKKEIDNYEAFIQKFLQNQYLYHYSEYDYIIYVLQRIVRRVGITDVDYLNSKVFQDYLIEYEAQLSPKVVHLFHFMQKEMPFLQ